MSISLFIPVLILLCSGLVAISSISMSLFYLQLAWVAVGVALCAAFLFFDWRTLVSYRWFIAGVYLASLFLLVYVLAGGPTIRNVKSWIVFGPFSFQPVEIMKIALILAYAKYFSRAHWQIGRLGTILSSFLLVVPPSILVAMQPALGSAIILFGIWMGLLVFSGLPRRRLLLVIAVCMMAVVLLWMYGLKGYQKERIVAIFYPEHDVLGINYSTIQSKIAIGSAGFWGKGYGQGSQTQLGFLTESESDFILAALIEEWGLLGGIVVLGTFSLLVYRILGIGIAASGNFEKLFCIGTAITLGLQFFLNAGSTTGLLPVVGVTYPFVSYGGTSLLANFALLGIVNAISTTS